MLNAQDIAKFFFYLDKDNRLFPYNDIVELQGSTMYIGNVRLNKYLHIAQNLYIAMYGKELFSNDMYAYKNGAIVKDVQINYQALKRDEYNPSAINDETKAFLYKIYKILENAPLDDLIKISHEDPEWEEKVSAFNIKQKMNSLQKKEVYRDQYADTLLMLERLQA